MVHAGGARWRRTTPPVFPRPCDRRSTTSPAGSHAARRSAAPGSRIADDDRSLDYARPRGRVCALRRQAGSRARRRAEATASRCCSGTAPRILELVFAARAARRHRRAASTPASHRPEIRQLLDDCTPRRGRATRTAPRALARAALRAARSPPAVAARRRRSPGRLRSGPRRRRPRGAPIAPVSPDDPMILMYTSGTTGSAQGRAAPAPQDALQQPQRAALLRAHAGATGCSSSLPLFHSFGLADPVDPGALRRRRVVLQRHFDPEAVWQTVGARRITYFGGVPTMFRALLEALARRPREPLRPLVAALPLHGGRRRSRWS